MINWVMFKKNNTKESENEMKSKTKITQHSDTLENCIKRHILDQESCELGRHMYDLFQSAFLKKNYFIRLSESQSTKINKTIKKHLQSYLKRIQKVSV